MVSDMARYLVLAPFLLMLSMPVPAQAPAPVVPPVEPPVTPECPVCPVCPTTPPVTPPATCAQKPIASANFTRETGFAYVLRMSFGTPPDKLGALTRSKLRLFENGVEIGPAHSYCSDDLYHLGQGLPVGRGSGRASL
jgi:hypothetical protein